MAGAAFTAQRLKNRKKNAILFCPGMAIPAGHGTVRPFQGKFGMAVVVEQFRLPARGRMAAAAIGNVHGFARGNRGALELTLVNILVAILAQQRQAG